ncbi:MAG: NADH-quinone oxidoreductase subunit I [Desulfarculus sp.]|nr:MAG: NADH-quinone oxidoreductase subunit I [Desulfarculus sp.]
MRYLRDVFSGAWSLAMGMSVTLRYMFKPVSTVQYPREAMPLPEVYRGHIELRRFAETGSHGCVACGECFRICPSGVIKVQGLKEEADRPNRAVFYFIDFSRCSLCGLCVEVCPESALAFSKVYEEVGVSRYSTVVDLIARLESQGA